MSVSRPILIVEDDAVLRITLVEQLALDGDFAADEAESAGEAEAKLASANARYDAILLDIGLPDADGRDFCAKLRREGRRRWLRRRVIVSRWRPSGVIML